MSDEQAVIFCGQYQLRAFFFHNLDLGVIRQEATRRRPGQAVVVGSVQGFAGVQTQEVGPWPAFFFVFNDIE